MYLILDEIDQLLSLPKICENFLSTLRAMKTMRSTNPKKTFALAGILGIGVFHVNKLILSGSKNSPFNDPTYSVSLNPPKKLCVKCLPALAVMSN